MFRCTTKQVPETNNSSCRVGLVCRCWSDVICCFFSAINLSHPWSTFQKLARDGVDHRLSKTRYGHTLF